MTATVEGRRQDSRTDILRIPSSLPRISQMLGDDSAARMRASLEYEHRASGLFYDRLTLRAHLQDAENHNANQQVRSNTTAGCSEVSGGVNTCRIDQDFYFEQRNLGLGAQFESGFRLGGHEHLLTYGLDLSRQEVSSKRDATIRNLTTGTVSKTLAGEIYPLHHPRLAMPPWQKATADRHKTLDKRTPSANNSHSVSQLASFPQASQFP